MFRDDCLLALLALETGHVLHGNAIGVAGIRVGELVFNTALTGYQEIISDPSYKEQIITFTNPHIGNTGINPEDFESKKIHAAGIVLKNMSPIVSNWRATISLNEYLQQQQVIAISDIDTRGLTKLTRQFGALRACIMAGDTDQDLAIKYAQKYSGLHGKNLSNDVCCTQSYIVNSNGQLHVVLVDFGVKSSILQVMVKLGCKVTVVPATTSAAEIMHLQPQAIVLSNGPGDPQACTATIATIKQLLMQQIPIFGICLGHQLLALAYGAKTYKMNFGHHGANHPVQNVLNKKVYITSQNHSFAVDETTLTSDLKVTHRSLFDHSLQGFRHKTFAIYGFQGHPEAGPGPHDITELFAEFLGEIKCQNVLT